MNYRKKFLEIYKSKISREGSAELLSWIESSDFFIAPASSKFHCAKECGLVEHSVKVYEVLREKHFDKSYQTKFSSFAYYYIIGEIHQYIRDTNKIKVSRKFIDLKKRVLQVKEEMTQRLGRVPTTLEISLMLDEDEKTIEEALLATDKVDSIDASSDSFPSYDFDMREDILDLREELKKLSLEEQKIIQARYYYDLTQQETSQLLGKSQVQISRYEGKILQKLKTRL